MSEMADEIYTPEDDLPEDAIVLDDSSAELMIARINEANEQYDRMEAWYKHQLDLAKQIRDRTIAWAERSLQGYLDLVPTKQTRTQKSYELPGATLILKKQDPKYDVNDEEMVPWLESNGLTDYVKVEKKAAWGDLKKALKKTESGNYVTDDGEFIPGLKVTPRADAFQVKIKGIK